MPLLTTYSNHGSWKVHKDVDKGCQVISTSLWFYNDAVSLSYTLFRAGYKIKGNLYETKAPQNIQGIDTCPDSNNKILELKDLFCWRIC